MNQEQKIQELENRIRVLENFDILNNSNYTQNLVNFLVKNGFVKINEFLDFTAGAGGNPVSFAVGEIGQRNGILSLYGTFIEFTSDGSSEELTPVGGINPLENYTGSVIVYSTGTPPSPLLSGNAYFVTNATSTYFELDNLTMTNKGVGRHYVQMI